MAKHIISIAERGCRLKGKPWTYDDMMFNLLHTVDGTEWGTLEKEIDFVQRQQEEIERLTKLCIKAYDLGYADGLKDGGKNG